MMDPATVLERTVDSALSGGLEKLFTDASRVLFSLMSDRAHGASAKHKFFRKRMQRV